MVKAPFKGGLFARLLTLCVLVSVASAAIVTLAFYSYRDALTSNMLAAELSSQAFATAPVAADRLREGDPAGASRLLRVFGGLHYVTCVDLVREGELLAAWPPPGCDRVQAVGKDRWITVPLPGGNRIVYRIRVDDRILMSSET